MVTTGYKDPFTGEIHRLDLETMKGSK